MEWGEIGTLNGISAGIEETQMLRVEVHWYVIPMYHAVVSLLDLFLLQSKQLHMVGRHEGKDREMGAPMVPSFGCPRRQCDHYEE